MVLKKYDLEPYDIGEKIEKLESENLELTYS